MGFFNNALLFCFIFSGTLRDGLTALLTLLQQFLCRELEIATLETSIQWQEAEESQRTQPHGCNQTEAQVLQSAPLPYRDERRGTQVNWAVYLVGILPLIIQEFFSLNPPSKMVPQPCQYDLSQVSRLCFCWGLHLWVNIEASISADWVHCRLKKRKKKKGWVKIQLIGLPPKDDNSPQNPFTCCCQLPSQPPDFQHGFVAESILFTEFRSTSRVLTGPHCSWKWIVKWRKQLHNWVVIKPTVAQYCHS